MAKLVRPDIFLIDVKQDEQDSNKVNVTFTDLASGNFVTEKVEGTEEEPYEAFSKTELGSNDEKRLEFFRDNFLDAHSNFSDEMKNIVKEIYDDKHLIVKSVENDGFNVANNETGLCSEVIDSRELDDGSIDYDTNENSDYFYQDDIFKVDFDGNLNFRDDGEFYKHRGNDGLSAKEQFIGNEEGFYNKKIENKMKNSIKLESIKFETDGSRSCEYSLGDNIKFETINGALLSVEASPEDKTSLGFADSKFAKYNTEEIMAKMEQIIENPEALKDHDVSVEYKYTKSSNEKTIEEIYDKLKVGDIQSDRKTINGNTKSFLISVDGIKVDAFYFDSKEKISDFFSLDGVKEKIMEHTESEDTQIETVKENGWDIRYIDNPSEAVQLEAVRQDGEVIKYIENPSENVKLEAVKENGYAIKYIENPSEAVKLEAVKKSGSLIEYIDNPSESVKLEAVKEDGLAIQYIENPTEEMKLEAVKEHAYAIQFIDNPSEAVQIEAVKQEGKAIKYIENPSEIVQLEAVKEDGRAIQYIENPSESVKLEAVKDFGEAIQYIENPTEEMKLEAIKRNGRAIQYVESPTEEMKLEAIKQDGWAIQYIENPTDEMKLEAVKQDGEAIYHIENPTDEMKLEAVKRNGWAIQYIENPSENVKLEAVKENGWAIQFIKNPSEAVQLEAVKENLIAISYIENPSEEAIDYYNDKIEYYDDDSDDFDSCDNEDEYQNDDFKHQDDNNFDEYDDYDFDKAD